MEPPSALPRGGRVPWQELLLAVSLLTFWNPPTTAQATIELVPPNAAEGKDVLLRVHNLPANLLGFGWFKGTTIDPHREIVSYAADSQEITPGLAHSGRETLYHNGSLLFQNISLEDTGYYTLQIIKRNVQVERVTGQLRVYPELPKPNITSNNSDPVENVDSVVLTCEPQTQNTSYLWSVNSNSLPDSTRLELSLDNRTLTLHGVTRNDTGPYECETWNPVSAGHSDPFTLNVLYGPDAPTISPSDSYYLPGANLSLSCHSASNPPAQYSWLINGSPQPSSQELFIPNITVNDSGSYTCLVYNPGTRLSKTTVKTITVSEPVSQPSINISNTTATEHKDSVVLTCSTNNTGVSIWWFFNNQSLKLTERMKLSPDNSTLTVDPVRREDAGDYQCEVSNPVSSSKSDLVKLNVEYDFTQQSSGLSAGAIAGIVIGVLAGVALIAALLYFLCNRKSGGTSDLRDLTEHKPSASNHSQDHSDNVHNKTDEVAYSSLNFNVQAPKKSASASPSLTATETVYSEVQKK
ncbi:carcinoembryonic antigen-related cell adhesion molecule 1-like isoform X1 [Neofelis nebulosa]|uniref:carcinoembryonic antigen-related cell adhesion molecule 1-like isoform X1 n=1 Tax=Neofelis nebulosa TaxID=61452 RepID=UPI00272A25D0|nr:carcinoembryonic antigen-related cell adhesion molecule 1-like isoform X1 [Neofelis nebulosa]